MNTLTKRILAVLATAAMIISLAAPALAAETNCDDRTSIDFNKLYQLANSGTESPAEDFTFNIEKAGVTNSTETLESMPAFAQSSYTVNFDEGGASVLGTTGTTTVDLPEYDAVGVYTYKVTETDGGTAGVTYISKEILITVTVINCPEHDGSFDRLYKVEYAGEAGNKLNHVENTYSAGSLTVQKKVLGKLGDKTRSFNVTVEFTAPAGDTVRSTIDYTVAGTDKQIAPSDWAGGKASAKFTLKNNQIAEFENIPYGVTYTVTEAEANEDGYVTSIKYSDEGALIDSAGDSVVINNSKDVTVETGIEGNTWVFAAIAGLIAVLAVILVLRRRQISRQG